jgi:hypothetical protein
MSLQKVKRFLDVAGTVACVTICAILIAGMVNQYVRRKPSGADGRVVKAGMRAGQKLPALPGIDYRQHERSVLLFLDSTCVHCLQSVPTYANLYEATRRKPKSSLALYGAFADGQKGLDVFKERGFMIPSARQVVSLETYRIAATPTIVVVDRSGTVEDFWVGELSGESLLQLTRLIEGTT